MLFTSLRVFTQYIPSSLLTLREVIRYSYLTESYISIYAHRVSICHYIYPLEASYLDIVVTVLNRLLLYILIITRYNT